MISDRKISRPEAHRTNITVADPGPDISSSVGSLTLQDQLHVGCVCECSAGAVAGAICLALWDKDNVFMGITESETFTAHSTWRNGASGLYVTPIFMFDSVGATKVKALVTSLSGGNITNLFLIATGLSEAWRVTT